jgi:hypothetical protein
VIGGILALLVVVAGACGPPSTSPGEVGVLRPGEQVVNACEEALLTLHQHAGLDNEFERLELAAYETCTIDQFSAFNDKVTDAYRYPGDGRATVELNCAAPDGAYTGLRLCRSAEPSGGVPRSLPV